MTQENENDKSESSVSLSVESQRHEDEIIFRIKLANSLDKSIWVPLQIQPSYRIVKENRRIIVSYGYFDDVHGKYRGRYMIPKMQEVKGGQEFEWVLQTPEIAEHWNDGWRLQVRTSAALVPIPFSNVRGRQKLDLYQENSMTLETPEIALGQ